MKNKPPRMLARQEEVIVTEDRDGIEIEPTPQRPATGRGAGAPPGAVRPLEPEVEPSPPIDLPTEGIGKSKLIMIGLGVVFLILFLKR